MKKVFLSLIIFVSFGLSGCSGMFDNEEKRLPNTITNSSSLSASFKVLNAEDDSNIHNLSIGESCTVRIPENDNPEILFTTATPITYTCEAFKSTIVDLKSYTLTINNTSSYNLSIKINNENYNSALYNGLTSIAGSNNNYTCYTSAPNVTITYNNLAYNNYSINTINNNPVIFIY